MLGLARRRRRSHPDIDEFPNRDHKKYHGKRCHPETERIKISRLFHLNHFETSGACPRLRDEGGLSVEC
jgi:hypothetical protein